jgi:hypothetical protein
MLEIQDALIYVSKQLTVNAITTSAQPMVSYVSILRAGALEGKKITVRADHDICV